MPRVILLEVWPSWRETKVMFAPLAIRRLANVCRRSCQRTGRSPGTFKGWSQCPKADVRCVFWRSGAGREYVVVGSAERRIVLMSAKGLRERWHENHVKHPALGLRRDVLSFATERRANVDQFVVEIDVSPMKAKEFALAESAEDRRREHRSLASGRSL